MKLIQHKKYKNTLGSSGGSYWMTTSTWGKSSPLAATSVQIRVAVDA